MSIFRWWKRFRGQDQSELTEIAKVIGQDIDRLVAETFSAHQELLLNQPPGYIVPAVWGARKDGELSEEQQSIYKAVVPAMKRVLEKLDFRNLNRSQEFAVDFLIRGLIISKIACLVEMGRGRRMAGPEKTSKDDDLERLRYMEPMGRA
ncbi:MAG: hypothetical protein JRI97_00010 [Deltaproteobacteria bacterium]|nr:hypothetical protein [Deltaproteobacteria bacterium]